MFAVVWEYAVLEEKVSAFTQAYGANGAWAALFARAGGYLGTELFRAAEGENRFLTIDRWRSLQDFETFKARFGEAYEAMDAECEALTTSERRLGELVE